MANNLMMPPGIFVQAVKQSVPGVTDAGIMNIYTQAINSDPAAKDMDPMDLAKIVVQTANKINEQPKEATTNPRDVNMDVPQPYVAPTARMGNLNPQDGTPAQQAFGDVNPADILHKQFGLADLASEQARNIANTSAQRAAEAEYQQKVMADQPYRTAGSSIAGFGAGSAGVKASNEMWDKKNELNKDLTIGAQTREVDRNVKAIAGLKSGVEQYQLGLQSAGSVVESLIKSGEFGMKAADEQLKQKKAAIDLAQNTELAKSMLDPKSPNSIAMRNAAKVAFRMTKKYTEKQINEMVPDTMSGVQATPLAVVASGTLKDALTIGQTNQAEGIAASSYATAGKTRAEIPGAAAESKISEAMAKSYVGPDGKLVVPPGQATTISKGGLTVGNSPGTTASQTEVANDQAKTRQQSTHYTTNIQDTADKLLASIKAGAGTGIFLGVTPASWGNTKSDVAQKAVNKIVAEEAAMNGQPYDQKRADTLFRAGPAVVADHVIQGKAEQARRNLKLADQQQHMSKPENNGTLNNYNPAPLEAMKPLYNPTTGKVILMKEGSNEWNQYVGGTGKDKWFPSAAGYYMNQGKGKVK
jgi:hypothetical protein